MTRVAFCADVHVGNHRRHGGQVDRGVNTRCRQALDVLDRAVDIAMEQGCSTFVVVGDLFDSSRPEPQLIAEVQRILNRLVSANADCYLIAGNHDKVSDAKGDNALAPLYPVAVVIDEPKVVATGKLDDYVYVHCVPHITGPDARAWVEAGFAAASATLDVGDHAPGEVVLAVHVGVWDSGSPAFLRNDREAVEATWLSMFAGRHNCTAVFTGNYHRGQEWTPKESVAVAYTPARVVQCGALVPTGWSDPGNEDGVYGSVCIFDSKDRSVTRYAVPGPRFFAGTDTDALAKELQLEGCALYVRATVPPDAMDAARRKLDELEPFSYEVLADDSAAHTALREAASSARAQTTLDSALDAYVGAMDVGEVPRADVLARCRGYLKG